MKNWSIGHHISQRRSVYELFAYYFASTLSAYHKLDYSLGKVKNCVVAIPFIIIIIIIIEYITDILYIGAWYISNDF